jgi:hypothetical protein
LSRWHLSTIYGGHKGYQPYDDFDGEEYRSNVDEIDEDVQNDSKRLDELATFKNSLKGIRIICSGPPYKARRKVKKKYHLWLSREFITGPMPLQSMDYTIDYYQSFVIIKRATLGIKV